MSLFARLTVAVCEPVPGSTDITAVARARVWAWTDTGWWGDADDVYGNPDLADARTVSR